MREKLLRIFLIGLLLLSIIAAASSLGVTPGRKIIDFSPNQEKELSFKIINSEDRQINLMIIVNGDLNNSFSINRNLVSIKPKEENITPQLSGYQINGKKMISKIKQRINNL
mgnify:CR=1 FL=1